MVHLFENHGYKIALDVDSGSVHEVDDLVYELIPQIEKAIEAGKSDAQIAEEFGGGLMDMDKKEAVAEILELKNAGALFSKDEYEQQVAAFTKREAVVKAMCLHIAHACNLGCKYCFAGEGEYYGPCGLMSEEVGKQALDYLVGIPAADAIWKWTFSAANRCSTGMWSRHW